MKKSKFTESQIVAILKEGESGVPVAEVVRKLEAGGLGLDDSVALWERGEALARRCEEQLAGARERVQKVLDEAASSAAQSAD